MEETPVPGGNTKPCQSVSNQTGFSRLELESGWWGNEKFDEWTDTVWGIVDGETDDAYHIALGATDTDSLYRVVWNRSPADIWLPKSKTDVSVTPNWTTFEPDGEPNGEILVATERRNKYGIKVALWGDTREALAQDEKSLLDGCWEELHATYDGLSWVVDEVNGILLSKLTAGGYRLQVSEEVLD